MFGAGLVFSQQLEIPPGHPGPDPAELAVGGGGPASHSQPGEQGEAFVQLQHRLESFYYNISQGHEIIKRLSQKYAILDAEYYLLDNFSVDGEKKFFF
jgi:hypothetical protein